MVVRFLSAAEHCYLQAVVSQPRTRLWLLPLQDSSTDTEKAMEQVLRLPELDVVHSKPAHAQWEPLQDWHIRKRNYQHRRKGRQWTAKADGAFESTPRTLADTDLKSTPRTLADTYPSNGVHAADHVTLFSIHMLLHHKPNYHQ